MQALQSFNGRSILQARMQEVIHEREAMRMIYAYNPKHMFKVNNVDYQIIALDPDAKPKRKRDGTIEEPTAKPITGSQIHGVFKTFLDKTGHSISEAWLTGCVSPLTTAFVDWLLNDYTPRYRPLRNEDGKKWLADICYLVVIDWIMLEKYYRYKRGEETFADDSVRSRMDRLVLVREVMAEVIQGISHSFKHNETAEERDATIERIFNSLLDRVELLDNPRREVLPTELGMQGLILLKGGNNE